MTRPRSEMGLSRSSTRSLHAAQAELAAKEEAFKLKQDTRTGNHMGNNTFFDNEVRFTWQDPPNEFDAFYTLPSAIGRKATGFGSSTRADWEGTTINKADGNNPNAGPGNYRTGNEQVALSTSRNPPKVKFSISTRPSMNMNTPSPGPAYNVDGVYSNGPSSGKIKVGFNKDQRPPLADNGKSRTDASYWPKLAKGRSITIASRMKARALEVKSPGPIYDVAKYGFRTGPKHTFGASRSSRFGSPICILGNTGRAM